MRVVTGGTHLFTLTRSSLLARTTVVLKARLSTSAALTEEVEDVAWNNARPYSEIPGPNKWEMFKLFRPGGVLEGADFFEVVAEFQRRYGNLCRLPGIAGKSDMVFVYEPEDVAKVYRSEGKYPIRQFLDSMTYHRTVHRKDVFKVSTGLIAEQGESWWAMRQKMNPVMMKPQATKVYVPKMDEISKEFVNRLESLKDSENRLNDDFLPLLSKWALESVCYVSMDVRVGLLGDQVNPVAEKFMESLRLFVEYAYKLDVLPSVWKYYKTPLFKAAMKNYDDIIDGALYFLEQGKKSIEENKRLNIKTPENEKGTLEKLLEIDENYALIMTLDSIFGGVDSTKTVFFNLLLNLANHPEKQEILRQEIMKVMPDNGSTLTMNNMKDMSYLRATIKESFRFTPFFDNFRSAGKDIVLQGYQIPQNTNISFAMHLLLKNDAHYPRSNEFLPERFLRNNEEAVAGGCPNARTAHPFIYLPFGFGTRMCIGRRFAELEIETLTTRLLRNFRVEWKGPPPTYVTTFGNLPVGKTNFIFNAI